MREPMRTSILASLLAACGAAADTDPAEDTTDTTDTPSGDDTDAPAGDDTDAPTPTLLATFDADEYALAPADQAHRTSIC